MFNFPRNVSGGGIVIYVKSNLVVTSQVINIQVSTFEFACVQIGIDHYKLTLLYLYKPPYTDNNIFCIEMNNLFCSLPADPNSLIVCGDYNIDALVYYAHFNNLISIYLHGNAYPKIFYQLESH